MMRVLDGGFCSSCFNHVVDHRVVEFPAAWDGPVTEVNGVRVSVDELRVCEPCLRNSFELLELDGTDVLAGVEVELREARALGERWRAYAEGLEDSLAKRPVVRKKTGKAAA